MMTVALAMSLVFMGLDVPGNDSAATVEEVLIRSFHGVSSLRQVEDTVVQELLRKTRGQQLADVGESFEPTDVTRDDRPVRRFVVGGRSDDKGEFWVICYEHGGRGYHYHVALFAIQGKEVEVLKARQWLPALEERQKPVTLDRILVALREGEGQEDDSHW